MNGIKQEKNKRWDAYPVRPQQKKQGEGYQGWKLHKNPPEPVGYHRPPVFPGMPAVGSGNIQKDRKHNDGYADPDPVEKIELSGAHARLKIVFLSIPFQGIL
jgi:hypothetical protein